MLINEKHDKESLFPAISAEIQERKPNPRRRRGSKTGETGRQDTRN